MRAVVQRVESASVSIDGRVHASIGKGLVVLVGVGRDDTDADADWLCKKIINLRIFGNGEGKMSLNVKETGGSILAVSQFTLFGDCRKGNRPDFTSAAAPREALSLYGRFIEKLRSSSIIEVVTGVFGAAMVVSLINDGPVTIVLDSAAPQA